MHEGRDVHLDHAQLLPGVRARERPVHAEAGVVDQDAGAPPLHGEPGRDARRGLRVREVHGQDGRADAVPPLEIRADLVEPRLVARHEDQVVPVLGEDHRQVTPDAARGARDERRSALDTAGVACHACLPNPGPIAGSCRSCRRNRSLPPQSCS